MSQAQLGFIFSALIFLTGLTIGTRWKYGARKEPAKVDRVYKVSKITSMQVERTWSGVTDVQCGKHWCSFTWGGKRIKANGYFLITEHGIDGE